MTHAEIRRLLEALYPTAPERAPRAADLLWRLIAGEPVGRLLSEAARSDPPPAPSPDATPIPPTLPDRGRRP